MVRKTEEARSTAAGAHPAGQLDAGMSGRRPCSAIRAPPTRRRADRLLAQPILGNDLRRDRFGRKRARKADRAVKPLALSCHGIGGHQLVGSRVALSHGDMLEGARGYFFAKAFLAAIRSKIGTPVVSDNSLALGPGGPTGGEEFCSIAEKIRAADQRAHEVCECRASGWRACDVDPSGGGEGVRRPTRDRT